MVDNTRPRIAMLAYTLYASDARVRRHVAALVEEGYEVDLMILSGESGRPEPTQEHVRFFFPRKRRFERQSALSQIREYVLFAMACSRILLSNHLRRRYCLVHVNNMPNFLVFSAALLRMMGIPVILDVHDTMPEIYQDRFAVPGGHPLVRALFLEERVSMRVADFVITTEHTKWERLVENGLSERKSAVTLNLPDPSVFQEVATREPSEERSGVFRLVYHGTLTRRLGMDVAVRAVDLARKRIPAIRLDIIGDGEQRAELVDLVAELGLGDCVKFSDGFIPTDELPGVLAGADLAVIPSRDSVGTSLMLPTKLLEYVRLGIPAVTVATPTIVRYFTDEQVRFFPSEDALALSEHIVRLYEHPEERLQMSRRAREFYVEHNFETERRRYLDIVEKLARKGKPIH